MEVHAASSRASAGRPLVGRETETADLVRLLRGHRVVTVTGPGGVGKTSLALAAAATATDESSGPVVVCELAEVEDPTAVRHAVAARLGVQNPDARLGRYVPVARDGSVTVVILDNCEHVLDAAAELVEELRGAGPHLRVVATSREPLRLADEVVLRLGPLAVPASAEDADAASSPSVVLFSRHAIAARRDVATGPDALARIVRICQALDGLPLALEIAGARARSFGLDDLEAQLDRRVGLPGADRRGLPGRHRSLTAVVEWSYDLLDADEQRLFAWLCVHPAGFTTAAAVSTATALGLAEAPALDLLDGLVTKSLVTLVESPHGTRYRILETLRDFGLARLEAAGATVDARDQHADYYAALMRALVRHGLERWDEPLAAVFWEYDNVRSAVAWTLRRDPAPDRAFDLLAAQWYVGLQESSREIARMCEAAVRRWPDATDHARYSEVVAAASVCLLALDELDEARRYGEEAVAAATSATGTAWGWRTVAKTSHHRGEVEAALWALDRADEAARKAGFEPLRSDLLGSRVTMLAQDHREGEAWACAQEALTRSTSQDNVFENAWALHLVGMLLVESDPAAAEGWLSSALEESTSLHYPYGVRVSMRGLGVAATLQGKHAVAADWFLRALDEFARAGMRLQHQTSIAAVVPLLVRSGHRQEAAVATAHLEVTGAVLERLSCPGFEAARVELAGDLGARDALARGRALNSDQVISLLRRSLRDIAGPEAAKGAVTPGGRQGPHEDVADEGVATGGLEKSGDLWAVTYAGTTVHLQRLKGLDDLAVLLAAPGREVPALDLATPGSRRPGTLGDDHLAAGPPADLGELVDATARAAYAARLRDLQRELDEADTIGDAARAARAQEEFEAISAHLASAYGLHGPRRTGDPAERARAAVTARLRSAITRLEELHPELGQHLSRSVRTGRFCSYHPDEAVVWTIRR